MGYNPKVHHRRSIRLANYDYSQAGTYFVTICTQNQQCLFGALSPDGTVQCNDAGWMIQTAWEELPQQFPALEIDAFIIMPNHVHGIIVIPPPDGPITLVGAGLVPAPNVPAPNEPIPIGATIRVAPTGIAGGAALGDIIGAFKSWTTVLYGRGVRGAGWPPFNGRLWQRNYHEHIIRNETEWGRIRQYIETNPLHWANDRENSSAKAKEE